MVVYPAMVGFIIECHQRLAFVITKEAPGFLIKQIAPVAYNSLPFKLLVVRLSRAAELS